MTLVTKNYKDTNVIIYLIDSGGRTIVTPSLRGPFSNEIAWRFNVDVDSKPMSVYTTIRNQCSCIRRFETNVVAEQLFNGVVAPLYETRTAASRIVDFDVFYDE